MAKQETAKFFNLFVPCHFSFRFPIISEDEMRKRRRENTFLLLFLFLLSRCQTCVTLYLHLFLQFHETDNFLIF